MKRLLYTIILCVLCLNTIQAQTTHNIIGYWVPANENGALEIIEIREAYDGKYSLRLVTSSFGSPTILCKLDGSTIEGEWEISEKTGEFWINVDTSVPNSKGHIFEGQEGNSYIDNGMVGGWLGLNQDYYLTKNRETCATIEKMFCCIKLVFDENGMTAYYKFKGVYYKENQPMFYQNSMWVLSYGERYFRL